MVGDALEDAEQTSWQNALKSNVSTSVTQHHNALQSTSWVCSLRYFNHMPDDDVDLEMQERGLYRGIVGSLQYMSIDRWDALFDTNASEK